MQRVVEWSLEGTEIMDVAKQATAQKYEILFLLLKFSKPSDHFLVDILAAHIIKYHKRSS